MVLSLTCFGADARPPYLTPPPPSIWAEPCVFPFYIISDPPLNGQRGSSLQTMGNMIVLHGPGDIAERDHGAERRTHTRLRRCFISKPGQKQSTAFGLDLVVLCAQHEPSVSSATTASREACCATPRTVAYSPGFCGRCAVERRAARCCRQRLHGKTNPPLKLFPACEQRFQ